MKKKILIFILCFTLIFTTSIYHDKNIQVVKATPALAISYITLALTSMGVTYYYQNAQTSLQNDIEIYCRDTNQDYSSWLGTFGNIVIDVGKKVVKYSAAQVYALKTFVNYLINSNKVSEVAYTSHSINTFGVYGYPCFIKLVPNKVYSFHSNQNTYYFKINDYSYSNNFYLGILSTYDAFDSYNSNYPSATSRCIILSDSTYYSGYFPNLYISRDNVNFSSTNILFGSSRGEKINFQVCTFVGLNTDTYPTLDGVNWFNYSLEGHVFANCGCSNVNYSGTYTLARLIEQLENRLSSNTAINSSLQSYTVDRSVFNTADDTKPLVVSAPQVIDKAVDIAVGANPDATAVSLGDVAIAIDETAVGVINPAAEDEDEKVIAPDLSLPLDTTQDLAVSDTITEDLVISDPVPPPDPPPDLPEIDFELGSKFPFSVFYDFVAIMNLFDATPVAPSFPLGFEFLGNEYEFIIDLSEFDSVARILRLMELIAFISGLVILTIKYIRGKE